VDFSLVEAQLNDLPTTFKREGAPYTQWVDAEAAELTRYTSTADEILAQVQNFNNARYGWLDFWGLLFGGIARMLGEADARYAQLISYTVTAGAGPGVAIAKWIQVVWGLTATVTENLPGIGYTISFAESLTDDQIAMVLGSLGRIRPAGVPITASSSTRVGTYLNTINFAGGAPSMTGAYFGGVVFAGVSGVAASTNNAVPLLPDLYLIDPALQA
jgi:hypothetical protein